MGLSMPPRPPTSLATIMSTGVFSHLVKTSRLSGRRSFSSSPISLSQTYNPRPHSKHFPIRRETFLPAGTYKDKVVLVTGGGTGLGKGMTRKFAELGAKVAIASRRLPVLEEAAKEITEETGGVVMPVQLDIRDPSAIREAGDSIEASLRLPPNAFQTIIDIVLKGTAFLTLDVGKRMIQQEKGGVFLAVTTTYLNEGSSYVVPSACAKSGVETLAKSLGVEWGKYGIRFNCIAPGPIETEGAFGRLDPTGSAADYILDTNPTGRIGEIEEIANLATFMCSDYASWINTETVTLDGGEFRSLAGEFNKLREVTPEMWVMMAAIIKENNKKSKTNK